MRTHERAATRSPLRWAWPVLAFFAGGGCGVDELDGVASPVTRNASVGEAGVRTDFDKDSARIDLECPSAMATGQTSEGLRATVSDAQGGRPHPQSWMRLYADAGHLMAETSSGSHVGNGTVEFSFAAPEVEESEVVTIVAVLEGGQNVQLARSQCEVTIVTEPLLFTENEAEVVRDDKPRTVAVAVAIDLENAQCDDGGGVRLDASGPSGSGLSLTQSGRVETQVCLDVTDGTTETVWMRGGDHGGTLQLQAAVNGFEERFSVTVVGAPETLELHADDVDIATGSATNVVVEAYDDVGNPIADLPIELEVTRCASTTCEGEEVAPRVVTTAPDGSATSAYFSGPAAGAAQVTAHVAGKGSPASNVVIRVF